MEGENTLRLSLEEQRRDWEYAFVVKRIGEPDLPITAEERKKLLYALAEGTRFVQVRLYTLMTSSLKSIEPRWGEPNVPQRPNVRRIYTLVDGVGRVIEDKHDVALLSEWEKRFGKGTLPASTTTTKHGGV